MKLISTIVPKQLHIKLWNGLREKHIRELLRYFKKANQEWLNVIDEDLGPKKYQQAMALAKKIRTKKVHPLDIAVMINDELTTMLSTEWAAYGSSSEIAWNDDIRKIVSGEAEEGCCAFQTARCELNYGREIVQRYCKEFNIDPDYDESKQGNDKLQEVGL